MTDQRTLIFDGLCDAPNERGVRCSVTVYALPERPTRFDIYVGGWRVATLKTQAGALRRAAKEMAR